MYQIIKCVQGTHEWHQARLGKWTASFFDKAITPTGKKSTSAKEVNLRLIAEKFAGRPDDTFQSEDMERGKELEDEARKFINFTYGHEFEECGFIDSLLGYGCSVDGIQLDAELGLEMKCPKLHTHLSYLAGNKLPDRYKPQVQGAMMVTGFKKWLFMSYYPGLPALVVEVNRDEEYISNLKDIVWENCVEVKDGFEQLRKLVPENYFKDSACDPVA